MKWDVIIVGAGPSGSVCAAHCARQGLKTLLLDRSPFPRDKVCGDCVNPSAWHIFERLDWTPKIRSLPSRVPNSVEFVSISGRSVTVPLRSSEYPEIAIRRRDLDASLVECACQYGATFMANTPVLKVSGSWKVETEKATYETEVLVAADGRNSSVCRFLGLMPKSPTDRVAFQADIPRPDFIKNQIRMMLFPHGYAGFVDRNDENANLCVVSQPSRIEDTCKQALESLQITEISSWKSIAPLARPPIASKLSGLFVIGDAARVVEPFTGEGIYYGMRSAEISAQAITRGFKNKDWSKASAEFRDRNAAMYSKTIWINQFARFVCERPRLGSFVIDNAPFGHKLLSAFTARVCEHRAAHA